MKQKCIILIDGSNFYFKLKDLKLHDLLNFDYERFSKFLARSNELVSATYYVGRVKQDGTEHTDKLLANQQKLTSLLKKHQVKYSFGYLMKSESKFHEKGVDVQMAVDILVATYENLCDRIIIVSSDTDLSPAIKSAQERGKIIEYIGFSHMPSVAMVRFCKESRILTKEDLKKFCKQRARQKKQPSIKD